MPDLEVERQWPSDYGNRIVLTKNGKYRVFVRIQDGTEDCGERDTEAEARELWVICQGSLNHRRAKPQEVAIIDKSNG